MSVLNVDTNIEKTVISLFCGTGGSSLGYHLAGYKELLAIDWDEHAVECFRLNFPTVPIWKKSVTEVTGKDILKFCNIKIGELDILDGSPPCQGFSTAGKRKVNDPRNDLFLHFVRLIKELQPKVFVMENVSGMIKGKMTGMFIEIMKHLKDTGYTVKCKKMNSANYGVPQSRERLIFIGTNTKNEISFPTPKNQILTLKKVCPNIKKQSRGQFDKIFVTSDRPSYTLTKTASMKFMTEDDIVREPTMIELLKICTFPEDWKLPGTKTQQWARLGNAVMPKFMECIALHIKETILNG